MNRMSLLTARATVVSLACVGGLAGTSSARVAQIDSVQRSTIATYATTDTNTAEGAWSSSLFGFNPQLDPPFVTPSTLTLFGGGGFATQGSSVAGDAISGGFFGKAWDGNSGFGGAGRSTLQVNFSLTSPTDVVLTGLWSHTGDLAAGENPIVGLLLTGPSGFAYQSAYNPVSPLTTSGTIGFVGTLAPGAYSLNASAEFAFTNLSGNLGSRQSQLSFTLSIPAPGSAAAVAMLGAWGCGRRRRAVR